MVAYVVRDVFVYICIFLGSISSHRIKRLLYGIKLCNKTPALL